jgi:ectoine hydroxylase
MASVMVALDKCTRENGCLQVLKSSHHIGRIDHGLLPGQQVSADPCRLGEILKRHEIVYAEMEPGDGLFFHCNTLHRSDQNRSPNRRWTVLFCYNAARNNPYREHHHPFYTALEKVSDNAIKDAGLKMASGAQENFLSRPFAPPDLKAKIAVDELKA